MPVIDPQGLFDGERLAACSDKAKLFWPFIYCASNGFARLEINPKYIQKKCFASFTETPTEDDIIKAIEEYAQNFLLVVYEHEGRQWVQFDTSSKYLPRHKSKKDDESPIPPPETIKLHADGYIGWKKAKSLCLQHSRKLSETFENLRKISHGIGIGTGIEIGVGVGVETETSPSHFEEDTDMNPAREIPKISMRVLHIETKIFPSDAVRLKELTAAYGGTRVTNDFTEWAEENVGQVSKPLSEYLKIAPERLRGAVSPAADKTVMDISNELTYLSDNKVVFNNSHRLTLTEIAKEGATKDEIEVAFAEFIGNLDTSNPRNFEFAAKQFLEGARGMIYTNRKKKQIKAAEQTALDHVREQLSAQGEREKEERLKAREEEESLIEDELGVP